MTDRQNDKMHMHITTLAYCNESRSVWSEIPVFGRYVGELDACVKEEKKIMQSQGGVSVKGAAAQKSSVEAAHRQAGTDIGRKQLRIKN